MYDSGNLFGDYPDGRTPNSPQPPTRYSKHASTRLSGDVSGANSVGDSAFADDGLGEAPATRSDSLSTPADPSWQNREVQQAMWPVDRVAGRSPSDTAASAEPDAVAQKAASGREGFVHSGATERFADQGTMQSIHRPAPAASSSTSASASAAVKPSNVKTFAMGFLGALLACVLAGVVFSVWWGSQIVTGVVDQVLQSSTLQVGTASKQAASDSQTIIVSEEDAALAETVAAKALPSVVYIGVYQSPSAYGLHGNDTSEGDLAQTALGSGIVLTEDGYILTNNHVVSGAEALKVTISGVEYDAVVVGTDPSSDVAVIKAENAEGLVAADIGDSDSLVVGQWVMTIGSPFGLEQSVATGVVSATSRSTVMDNSSYSGHTQGQDSTTIYANLIQTDAAINPGNSGGALVDAEGKVIGVNTLISSYSGSYSGVGFAIPINYAMSIAEQIMAGEVPTHAQLGVAVSTVNGSVAKRNNLPVDSGAYVSQVMAGSGADDAGIQTGDIITAIDGKKVTSASDVPVLVRSRNPGDTVEVTLVRDGEQVTLNAVLGSDAV